MAQSIERPTPDFGLGHDPTRVVGLSPVSGSELSVEPAYDSLLGHLGGSVG